MTTEDFLPPTEDELREAEALARALEDPASKNELAVLAEELKSAWSPAPLPKAANAALVDAALRNSRSRSRVVMISGTAAVAFAAAATLLLFLSSAMRTSPGLSSTVRADLVLASSTESLFREAYGVARGSDRIDRIAYVRASALRENRFRGWGVR